MIGYKENKLNIGIKNKIMTQLGTPIFHTTEEYIDQRVAEFKAQLLKELSPKTEFEKGKWYYFKNSVYSGGIFKIGNIRNNRVEIVEEYGSIGPDEQNHFEIGSMIYTHSRPATESEVKEALIKEAEKRGFKEGVGINNSMLEGCSNTNCAPDKNNFVYNSNAWVGCFKDALLLDSFVIYQKGKWATIVKEEAIKIGGHEVKFAGAKNSNCNIVIGCKTFLKDNLIAIQTEMKDNNFKTIQFDDAPPVSLDTINAILEKLK